MIYNNFKASIWAGDLITVYTKYADTEGWTVSPVSDTQVDWSYLLLLSLLTLSLWL